MPSKAALTPSSLPGFLFVPSVLVVSVVVAMANLVPTPEVAADVVAHASVLALEIFLAAS